MHITEDVAILGLFPTPVFIVNCKDVDLTSAIQVFDDCVLNERESNEYGARSVDTYILNRPECSMLKSWVETKVLDYARNVLGYDISNVAITQSWVSVKCQGQKHTAHVHPNSIISGVFYWNDIEKQPIVFSKPNVHELAQVIKLPMVDNVDNPFASNGFYYHPRKNDLVLFPSFLKHSVGVVNKGCRKSLAFNIMPRGKFGDQDSLYELDFSLLT